MTTKYIVWANVGKQAIIFGDEMSHSDVAYALGIKREELLGAGFCHVGDGEFQCYGESVSLRTKSRGKEDENVLNNRCAG